MVGQQDSRGSDHEVSVVENYHHGYASLAAEEFTVGLLSFLHNSVAAVKAVPMVPKHRPFISAPKTKFLKLANAPLFFCVIIS